MSEQTIYLVLRTKNPGMRALDALNLAKYLKDRPGHPSLAGVA